MNRQARTAAPGAAVLYALSAVIYAVMAASLWLPFGFNIGDISDLRALYVDSERGLLPLIAPADPRPLMLLMTHLARALNPDSFTGANLLLWALLTLKACALYALLRGMLPHQPLLAFTAGALSLILPVDTGIFWLVTINIHGFALAALTAAALLIAQWRHPRAWRWPLIAAAQLLALSYEAAFIPLLAVPALLPLIDRPSRRMLRVALLWWALPLTAIIRFAAIFSASTAASYQTGLIALSADAPAEMVSALVRVYERHAITGWIEAFEGLTRRAAWEPSWFVSAAIGAASAALGAAAHIRPHGGTAPLTLRMGLLALIGGASAVGLGFAAFLPTVYRDINYRVFIFSSPGAAVALAVPLMWLAALPRRARQVGFVLGSSASFALSSRLPIAAAIGLAGILSLPRRAAAAALLAVLAGAGALLLIEQHDRYAQIARQQDWILSQIVSAAPAVAPETAIIVIDSPDRIGYAAFEWQRGVFESALRFLYRAPIEGFFCIPDGRAFGFFNEQCAWTANGIRLDSNAGATAFFPFERVILFDFTPEQGVMLRPAGADRPDYNPQGRIDAGASPPARVFTALIDYPAPRPGSWLTFFDLR